MIFHFDKDKRNMARISASGIGEILTGGKTADSYIFRKSLEGMGIKDEITTWPMRHGIINQHEAFKLLLQDKAKWHDEYTPIDERCGASADAIGEDMVWDVKCPYYIDTYLEQVEKLPKKYYYQVQMQMIAEKKDKGAVLLYLTSPDIDQDGNTIEYPYPLEDRHFIHQFGRDEEIQCRIMEGVDKYHPVLVDWTNRLSELPLMDRDEFFYTQLRGDVKFRKLKTASNINTAMNRAIRVGDEFYYLIN